MHKNVRRLRPEIWRQRNWLLHHNAPSHTSFFDQGVFTKKQHGCRHPPTLHFSVFPIGDKTGTDTIEVIEAES
jgi:hypothetical protein